MSEGLWMLLDHNLAMARQTPDFASPLAKVEVWIRFSGLNLLSYDENFFIGLKSIVGTPVKVNVNGQWYNVQYEGLHIICSSCGCYGYHICDYKKTPNNLMQTVVPTVAQPRGPSKNDDVHEQRLTKVHQKVSIDSAKIVAKEFEEIKATHGDWLVAKRKKRNKRVSYCQGKSLFNNVPRDLVSYKIKGIDVSLKGISADNKIAGPNQLDAISNKRRFDMSGPTSDVRQPTHRGDSHANEKFSILEPHRANIRNLHKTKLTFDSCPSQKGVPSITKTTSTIPIVNFGLETILRYNIPHFEPTISQTYGNNQCAMDEEEFVRETHIE
ncbi:hypothetical protein KIW84_042880 [Lathyrus oleraceus]|uniref:DUF4283 domain-containing protein n=1 Tax=Pisum sativum TaxID=3888 RepID=A0A9D4XC63_PEA|nr:hypothetical protein KIW84_042880 [Pisum sativum]